MMAMKERKDEEIDEVMNDAKKKDKLSVNELLRLFGEVGEDEDGKPFIFADDEDIGEERTRVPAHSDDEELGNEE